MKNLKTIFKILNYFKWLFLFWALFVGLFTAVGCVFAEDFTCEEIADAIYIAEGKELARQPYGIETYECEGAECRRICINTIRNQVKRHNKHDCGFTYAECLSRRYCPPNHKVWLKNVKYWLNERS